MTTMKSGGSLPSETETEVSSSNIHIQQREKKLKLEMKLRDHRKDVVKAIASLPKKASLEQVKSVIDPLYEKIEALLIEVENLTLADVDLDVDAGGDTRGDATQKSTSDDDDSVTPLMVACNKEQIHCLEYFARKYSHSEKTTSEEDLSNSISVGEGDPPSPKKHKIICNIIGHCLDATHLDGMNQAIHYVALSQMEPHAIDYLATILYHEECCQISVSGSSQNQKEIQKQKRVPLPLQIKSKSLRDSFMKLLSQRNQNGDTPIMMAAAAGNSNILKYWISTVEKDVISIPTMEQEPSANQTPVNSNSNSAGTGRATEVAKLLSLSNNTRASALSLASGHGHVKVVELLISYSDGPGPLGGPPGINGRPGIGTRSPYSHSVGAGRVNVRYEDMKRVKEILQKMKLVESSRKVPADRLEEFKSHQRNIQQCLVMMQVASAKFSEDISAELLSESNSGKDNQSKSKSRNKSKSTKKKKTSKDKLKKRQGVKTKTETLNGNESESENESETISVTKCNESAQSDSQDDDNAHIEKPSFVTLENGTVVSRVDAMSYKDAMASPNRASNQINASCSSSISKPIQTLLRDRCLQTHKNVSNSTNSDSAQMSEAEEVMESLCLDASMLLLPPHGLAMNLSPSQLEAVENVLMIQISAVREAKDIHRRLMTSNNAISDKSNKDANQY